MQYFHLDLTSWRGPDQTTFGETPHKEYPIDKYPLQLKSESALGSGKCIELSLEYGEAKSDNFVFIFCFGNKASYQIYISGAYHEIDLTPCFAMSDKQNEIMWTLERSENTVFVFCNGIKIIDYEKMAVEENTGDDRWRPNSVITFWNEDNATTAYRFLPRSK